MRWIYKLSLRLRSLFRREHVERELSDELRFHLENLIQEKVAQGMTPEEARYAALRELGGLDQVKDECRDMRQVNYIENFLQDVRYGLVQLRRNPGFTAVAIITLALGIGANAAIFSVVEGVMLAPLPYDQPDRLVAIWESNLRFPHVWISYPNFRDWQREARSFQQMAAFMWQSFDLTNPGTPEHLDGKEISAGFFTTLGVRLALGRDFSVQEDQRGGAPMVIISNRLWRNRFASSPEALGKFVTLDGIDYSILGVVPPRFHFEDDADVYTPLGQGDPTIINNRQIHPDILAVARLRPGMSILQAQAEMSTIQNGLDKIYPDADRDLGTDVEPLKQQIVGNVDGTLLLLLGAVGLVLLTACANFASLLLAHSAVRTREFAIRSALGANRARVVRQLLTESVLLSLAGGGLGFVVGVWGVSPVLAAMPGILPRTENIGLNVPVLLFTFTVSIVVGILFGLAPALKSSNPDLDASLKEGSRGSTSGRHRAQSGLVIVQMALTLVLLVAAGLLFRTIRHLWDVNPGFDMQHLITFKAALSPSSTKTPSDTRIAYQQLIERIRQIPGVQAADFTNLVPLSGQDNSTPFWVGSQQPASLQAAPRLLLYWTGPNYLRTMQIRLLRGRFFTPDDTTKSVSVIVIDSVLARMYFPGRNPVGQTITIANWGAARIVGEVGHIRHWGLGNISEDVQNGTYYPQNQTYASFYQLPDQWVPTFYKYLTVAVRTPLAPATVLPAIKKAVYGAGAEQPIYNVQTMQEIASESMASRRFPMILLGAFAGLALLLATVGIYGVISYSVAQRVHEIGVRMALGAERSDVLRLVVGKGFKLTMSGVGIGILCALALTRFLASLLFGVNPIDPLTFIAVSLILIVVAILASYIPARRATKVDPMVALRYE